MTGMVVSEFHTSGLRPLVSLGGEASHFIDCYRIGFRAVPNTMGVDCLRPLPSGMGRYITDLANFYRVQVSSKSKQTKFKVHVA